MNIETIIKDIEDLPPEKQEVVADFVAFLLSYKSRVVEEQSKSKKKPVGFVGMWADRPSMADSVAWVRRLRESEWD